MTPTTADDLIVNLISKGLSHTALGQLDKHSDEHGLQRVSSNVVDSCSQTENILRTDVRELIRPWFTTDHDQMIRSLFITISAKGIVYCTDDHHRQVFYYRQTPLSRREYMLSVKENSRAMTVKSQIPRDNTFSESKTEVNYWTCHR